MIGRIRRDDDDPHALAVRAAETMASARTMPPGRKRDEALHRAEQLRAAATTRAYLASSELQKPN